MRFSDKLLVITLLGAAACGPTYVVQAPPGSIPPRAPEPPRVPALEVSIVRTEENRVLVQTSRQAYIAVFEIVPGRGVSLVYPVPMRPRNVQQTGLTWVNVYWTMRPDWRYASADTRYIYAVASDTPLRLDEDDYDSRHLQRALGSAYWSSSPNAAAHAISREFVRAQPDEWWGEDMTSMPLTSRGVAIAIRLARVYCPDGSAFEVREDMVDRVWCPARRGGARAGERPGAAPPDSIFSSNGRRVARRMDPNKRTPVFRIPAASEIGQQQGRPQGQPQNPPQTPAGNNPPTPPQTPPQTQPPQNQPPQNQPPQTQPQDPNDKDHHDNGRRAHGDPRNADPRGNGNGYGNGGREQQQPTTQPTTQPPANNPPANSPPVNNPPATPPSNPQPQQQGQPQAQPNNKGNDAPKGGIGALLKNRGPQGKDKEKKADSDSTDKKKP